MDLNLNGKKALVLGSSMGIGKAVAQSLISEGVEVCLNSRNEENLKKTCSEIGAKGFIAADLTKPGAGTDLITKAQKLLGNIDILVTNTGGPQKNNFMEVTSEQWNEDFQSIWMSTVDTVKAVIPSMKERSYGRVLMITSVAGKEPMAGLTTSNGLRAGLLGLTKSICHEVAQFGITLNILMPGFTNTDRLKNLNLTDEYIKGLVPAGRLGEPNEIADLATFLASSKGAYINGQAIAVDGGFLKGY